MKQVFILALSGAPMTWIDGSKGDPGRTTDRSRAKRYRSQQQANRAASQYKRRYGRSVFVMTEVAGATEDDGEALLGGDS